MKTSQKIENWIITTIIIAATIWGLSGCGEVTPVDMDGGTNDSGNGGSSSVSVGGNSGGAMGGSNSMGTGGSNSSGGSPGDAGNSPDIRVPTNSPCYVNSDCISNNCQNNMCGGVLHSNGDGCTNNAQCVSNWCNPVMGICQNMPVQRQPGETCAYDWECANGFCSTLTVPNTCHLTLNPGIGPCNRNTQCGSNNCDPGKMVCL